MPRRFNTNQRVAMFLAAGGRCTACGTPLQPGWHGDHINPWSHGGPTDVINGQALCPTCNLTKGASVNSTRSWQAEALGKFLQHDDDSFLVTATPGAGKTRFALSAARELLDAGVVDRVVVVCPTAHLRHQWMDAAHKHFKIQLNPNFTNGEAALAHGFHGPVVTYQSVREAPQLYRLITSQRRTLVILDEVHHAGETKSWGDALRTAFDPAVKRILLSGTPFRSDSSPIPYVHYVDGPNGIRTSRADYSYGYGKALQHGVVRPIVFNALDGEATWRDAGVVVQGKIDNTDVEQAKRAVRAAFDPGGSWIPSVLRSANEELGRIRTDIPDAGGLVVASDQYMARAYADILEQVSGEKPLVAISDEPDASQIIKNFSNSTSRWLVAVQMVSEGVDIPRLSVGVYATKITTALFFRQVVGRFVRTRGDDDELCAALFLPSLQTLLKHAEEIEIERDHALDDQAEGKVEPTTPSGQTMMLPLNLIETIDSSEAVHHSSILAGDSFADAELSHAAVIAKQAGMPGNVQAAQVARLLRLAGVSAPEGTPVASVEVPRLVVSREELSLADQLKALRKQVNMDVARLARQRSEGDDRRRAVLYPRIHGDLNKMMDDTLARASKTSLQRRREVLGRWLRQG